MVSTHSCVYAVLHARPDALFAFKGSVRERYNAQPPSHSSGCETMGKPPSPPYRYHTHVILEVRAVNLSNRISRRPANINNAGLHTPSFCSGLPPRVPIDECMRRSYTNRLMIGMTRPMVLLVLSGAPPPSVVSAAVVPRNRIYDCRNNDPPVGTEKE